jgi:hypothetical protein
VSDDVDEPQFELGRHRVIERRRSFVFRRPHVILSVARGRRAGSELPAQVRMVLPHHVYFYLTLYG